MPHRQQKPSTQKQKNIPFSNFLPLIAVIRADLGADWAFYEEFLESVVDAAGRGEDSSAWYEQMEALVGDQVSLRFSHEGVCVLLRGLEGRAREVLDSADRSLRHGAPAGSMVGEDNARCITSRSRDVGVGLMLPPSSVQKARKASRHSPTVSSTVSPNVSSTLPPTPSSTLSSSSPHPTPSSKNDFTPPFFTDPTFHSEINKYFRPLETAYSTPDQAKHGVAETGDGYEEPAYFAEDDDLAVWRKHVEDGNWLL
ncbi:predicted protein [Plenodomus lingam JN3]|uniref:Predicted protein n=1 Tax=Leptosphaeria maculans (strain JN3 / isolate v23.1.3 / race Av1-4-5-6-7-8) TaxID=985895 RepID=E5R5D0_LEPMJ|nr:predicted protein [Plenodomus lingam JN3]CBX92100.1 predicted protein [Plenodomus lingam JN3]